MIPRFQSEFGEDAWLASQYSGRFTDDYSREKGIYVDVGCGHPVIGSNTAWLRELGWTGLHIDADERWTGAWAEAGLPLINAVVSTHRWAQFRNMPAPTESRVITHAAFENLNSKCVTLDSLLEQAGIDNIDFLSIDVEGHEFEVLNSLSLERYRPQFIIAEYNTAGLGYDFRVLESLLKERKYRVVWNTLANIVFIRESY